MRLGATKTGASTTYNGLGDQLYDKGGARPTLDLNFASNGSLVDSVTGKTLVTHTRASDATYVDGDGIIKDAVTNLALYSTMNEFYSEQNSSVATYTVNQTVAPDETLTGNKFTELAVSGGKYARSTSTINTFTAGKFYLVSVYFKEGVNTNKRYAGLIFPSAPFTSNITATFDLTGNGTVYPDPGANNAPDVYGIESVGNGWYRCWIGKTATVTNNGRPQYRLTDDLNAAANNYTGDGSSHIFMWGTQLEEFDSQQSTPGEYVKTTSTINSAPRFDHKVTRTTTNYIPYSEAILSNAVFGPNRTIVDNTILAPDGALTAATVTATGTDPYVVINTLSGASAGTYTFSVYLKGHPNNSSQTCKLRIQDAGTGLQTGIAFDITGEWRRYSFTATTTGDLQSVRLDIPDVAVSGDIVYVWGFQIERNADVGPYVKTTGAAATKVDAEPLGLLVEEARTNSIRNNTMQGAVVGAPGTAPTNWAISSIGLNYDVVELGKENGIDYIDIRFYGTTTAQYGSLLFEPITQISAGAGQAWTTSSYLKLVAGSFDNLINKGLAIWEYDSSGIYVTNTSTVHTITETLTRYKHTRAATSGTTAYVRPGFFFNGPSSAGVAIDFTIRIGLPQAEQGSFETTVIRTEGSTVTRSADVTSIEGNDFGTFNLLQYSEEFDNAGWTAVGTVTVDDNADVSPYGANTADKLSFSSGSYIRQQVSGISSGATYTISAWVKKTATGGADAIRFTSNNTTAWSTGFSEKFTLTTDWQRFTATGVLASSGSAAYVIFGGKTEANVTDSDCIGDVLIWGAQLEESSTATPYVKSDVTWTSRASNATYYDYTGTLRKSSYNLVPYSQDATQWLTTNCTATNTTVEAPDNSLTAISLEEDLVTAAHVARTPGVTSVVANTQYTMSVFAKPGVRDFITLQADASKYDTSGALKKTFDIANGTLGETNGTIDDAAITAVGNGWYRCSMTFTSGTSPSGNGQVKMLTNDTSDSTNSKPGVSGVACYVWGAQLETGPYAGDYAKTEASAVSTARDVAFLPDGSGNFVSAGELLLEDAGTNLVSYSEEFDNSYWSKINASVTPNQTTAPDGTLTADKIVDDTTLANHGINKAFTNFGQPVTYSVYAKAGEKTRVSIGSWDGSSGMDAFFDLTTGTVTSSNFTDSFIENVGNGWYRCRVSRTPAGNYNFAVYITDSSGRNYAGDGTSGIYLWGAQQEENSYATSYIPTFGSSATRAADVSSSSSNTFGNSFYNQDASTVFVDWYRNTDANFQTYEPLFRVKRTASPYDFLSFGNTNGAGNTNAVYWTSSVGGVNQLTYKQYNAVLGFHTHAMAITTDDGAFSVDGFVSTRTDSSITMPTALQQAIIGELNNPIKRITYWPERLSNESLNKMTN